MTIGILAGRQGEKRSVPKSLKRTGFPGRGKTRGETPFPPPPGSGAGVRTGLPCTWRCLCRFLAEGAGLVSPGEKFARAPFGG